MNTNSMHDAGPFGLALLALELMGFDAQGYEPIDDAHTSGDQPEAGDFRLSASLGPSVSLHIDYVLADLTFHLAALVNAVDSPNAMYLDALKINYLLPEHRRIAFDPAKSSLEIRSRLPVEHLALEDLALELSQLAEIALELSGSTSESDPPIDLGHSNLIRG